MNSRSIKFFVRDQANHGKSAENITSAKYYLPCIHRSSRYYEHGPCEAWKSFQPALRRSSIGFESHALNSACVDQRGRVCSYFYFKTPRLDIMYIDILWLLIRCDLDVQFVCTILSLFKEHGRCHIASLLDAVASDNIEAIRFHAVSALFC